MAKRVLIVDDSPLMRMLVKNALVPNGFEVAGEAADGKAALEAYQKLKPDYVTMDLAMPVMDGLAALRAIRAADPQARVVMVTAAGQHSIVQEALRLGASGFLVKPFKGDAVVAAFNAAPGGGA